MQQKLASEHGRSQKAFRSVTAPDMRRGAFRGDDHWDARVRLNARCFKRAETAGDASVAKHFSDLARDEVDHRDALKWALSKRAAQ